MTGNAVEEDPMLLLNIYYMRREFCLCTDRQVSCAASEAGGSIAQSSVLAADSRDQETSREDVTHTRPHQQLIF
jgi:hypothetical protein